MFDSPPTSDPRQHLERATQELRRKFESGALCRCEELLSSYPEVAADPECAISLIIEEYQLRCSQGQTVRREEYLERFPTLRDRLADSFQKLKDTDHSQPALVPTVAEATLPAGPHAGERPRQRRLGQHELMEEIGRGGMGVVHRTRHVMLDQPFALKTINSDTPELLPIASCRPCWPGFRPY
jgi:hypothetical protein